jgi:5-methyltetrahydropteroyltriglutamate--homocysteine methyltransferase
MYTRGFTMAKLNAPFRYDIVGSFLRPAALKEARAKHAAGELSAAELTSVENHAINELVNKEKSAGLKAVTDGEFRRRYWHLDFLSELEGVQEVPAEKWSVQFKGAEPRPATVRIVDKIGFGNHPFVDHFDYLRSVAGEVPAKMTIPSPSMLHLICCIREKNYQPCKRYAGNEELLFQELADAYSQALQTFYDHGCRYLQLDDTSWGELCDKEKRSAYETRGIDLDKLAKNYVAVINKALANKPNDLVVTMHICRGNFRSTWFSSGGYEPVAQTLFGQTKVDGFFLEYDSDRAGGFEPLSYITDQRVVLGLVTSKSGKLENPDDVKRRIEEASKFVPLEQLCLSPQCGFSSTEEGNILTENEQWAKIALIKRIAEDVWGDNA